MLPLFAFILVCGLVAGEHFKGALHTSERISFDNTTPIQKSPLSLHVEFSSFQLLSQGEYIRFGTQEQVLREYNAGDPPPLHLPLLIAELPLGYREEELVNYIQENYRYEILLAHPDSSAAFSFGATPSGPPLARKKNSLLQSCYSSPGSYYSTSITLSSGSNYGTYLSCIYTIATNCLSLDIVFSRFDIGSGDSLKFTSGNDTLAILYRGSSPSVLSVTPPIKVTWTTDGQDNNYPGWAFTTSLSPITCNYTGYVLPSELLLTTVADPYATLCFYRYAISPYLALVMYDFNVEDGAYLQFFTNETTVGPLVSNYNYVPYMLFTFRTADVLTLKWSTPSPFDPFVYRGWDLSVVTPRNLEYCYSSSRNPLIYTDYYGQFASQTGDLYQNSLDCYVVLAPLGAWTVTIQFMRFNTESTYDILSFSSGASFVTTKSLAGSYSNSFSFTVNAPVGIWWHTDSSAQYVGWNFTYSASTNVPDCFTLVTFTNTTSLISVYSSFGYGPEECYYLIQHPSLQEFTVYVRTFDIPTSDNDHLQFWSTSIPTPNSTVLKKSNYYTDFQVSTTTGYLLIKWYSDNFFTYSSSYPGWEISTVPSSAPSLYPLYSYPCSYSYSGITTSVAEIESNPNTTTYSNNLNCQVTINPPGAWTIYVVFSRFRTESNYDFLSFTSTGSTKVTSSFSGSSIPSQFSIGAPMKITWKTDGSNSYSGWRFTYVASTSLPDCYTRYTSGSTTVQSSSLTSYSGSVDCYYLFDLSSSGRTSFSVVLNTMYIPSTDYLQFWTSSRPNGTSTTVGTSEYYSGKQISTTTGYLLMKWFASNTYNYQYGYYSWKVTVQTSGTPSAPTPSSGSTSTTAAYLPAIIGGSVGGIIFIIIALGCIGWCASGSKSSGGTYVAQTTLQTQTQPQTQPQPQSQPPPTQPTIQIQPQPPPTVEIQAPEPGPMPPLILTPGLFPDTNPYAEYYGNMDTQPQPQQDDHYQAYNDYYNTQDNT